MLSQNDKNTHQTKEKSSYDLVLTVHICLVSKQKLNLPQGIVQQLL